MILHPKQNEIAEDRHRFRVLCCGRRFGKTYLAIEEIKGFAYFRNSRIAYIATNYQQARDIAWEILKKELGKAVSETNETRLEIKCRNTQGGESLIVLRGWESVENLRGQAFDFLVIDEVASMRDFWSNWQEVLRPTLTDRKGQVLFCSTPQGFNHFYDLFNFESKNKEFKSFHFTSYDNPFLPKEEIDSAKAEVTPDRFAQEYLAEFKKSSGLVYKEFSREKHLYEELPQGDYEYISGVDFGYANPAAVLHIYYGKETFWVDDEWYKRGRTDRQIAEYVKASNFKEVYPDPENPGAIDEMRELGVNVREVIKHAPSYSRSRGITAAKGGASVIGGIQKVREGLLNNRIKVNKRCLNLIQEFESYSYDDDGSEGNKDEKPVKANDHALDALRYVVMMKQPDTAVSYRQLPIESNEFEGGYQDPTKAREHIGMNVFSNRFPGYEQLPIERGEYE